MLPAIALRREGPQHAVPVGGACLALTGWDLPDYASGSVDFASRIHPQDRTRVASALENERYSVEYRIESRDGTLRTLRESGVHESHGIVHALALDVSRERALESQLFETRKLEAAGRLAEGVAHDFNNLLTAMLGYSELLAEALPAGGVQRAQAQQVVHAAQRAAELTRRLLLFTRRTPAEPWPFDLSDLLFTIDPLLRRLLGEDAELVTLPGPDPGLIEADPGQIEQVLVHLAVRARLAMPKGGTLSLETRAALTTGKEACVQLLVSDTGAAQPTGVRDSLASPGLATCRALVEHAGGSLTIASSPEGGTMVTLEFPRSTASRHSARLRSPAVQVAGGSETILLVEGEPLVRRMAGECLAQLGYEVLSARSGVEALELLASRTKPVHLVVTDVVLPQMSGGEVARRVREASPTTRVLYVSGYGERSLPAPESPDAASFLAKPFTAASLAAAVRAALGG